MRDPVEYVAELNGALLGHATVVVLLGLADGATVGSS